MYRKSQHTVAPPKQTRSRRSLDRMLDAAERLLGDRSFEELTIQDVVRASRTSVGVFYSRFRDKEALLDALYERHQQRMVDAHAQWDPRLWEGVPVDEIVRRRVRAIVDLYTKNRGLMRALVLRGHQRPDWRYADEEERDKLVVVGFGRLVESRKQEIGHPNPRLAGSLGYLMVLAAAREKILFGDSTASAVAASNEELTDELTCALQRYLGVGQSDAGSKRKA